MKKLLFATNNPGKLHEIKTHALHFNVEVIGLSEYGINIDIKETGTSYKENALIKIKSVFNYVNDDKLWIAGDDSGIGIDALNGEPGIHTRRWIGREMTDAEIIDYTLKRLQGVPTEKRTARFNSIVALGKIKGSISYFHGELNGLILEKPNPSISTQKGFPFRQLFYIPDTDRMIGDIEDLSQDVADKFFTHRQKAFSKIFNFINDSED